MDEQTRQAADSSSALRELALRLLTFHFSHLRMGQQAREPQLLVGQLPPDLPVELPLPEGSRLLGSLAQENPLIVVDTELATEDAMAFYRERLAAAGWIVQEHFGPHQGGFIHSSMAEHATANFFSPDDRYTLAVMTAPAPAGRTGVQLTLYGKAAEFRPRYMRHGPDIMEVLPPIRPPKGARQMPGGGGGGPDNVETSATLETDLDLAAVSTHYLGELEHAGWQRLDAGTSGPAAWSAWSFTDKEGASWQALLFILQRPGRLGKYALTLRAEAEDDARQSGPGRGMARRGWSSSAPLIGTQWHTIEKGPPTPPAEPKPPEPQE